MQEAVPVGEGGMLAVLGSELLKLINIFLRLKTKAFVKWLMIMLKDKS